MAIFTKHARRRFRQRNIARSRAANVAGFGKRKYLGNGKWKSSKNGVTTIYAKSRGKRVVITSYRSER